MGETTVIRTEGLTKYYGKARGVENLNLEVREGEVFGFLGPNGAGKTTTIRLLLGLIRSTAGSAFVLGFDCWHQAVDAKRAIGFVPDNVRLYENLTGEQLLDYLHGFQSRTDQSWRDELTRRLDLNPSQRVKDYSRGNRQKLALVAALMHRPRVLVLDEPTIGLDPLMQHEFYRILREYRDAGGTIFMSSHVLPEVEKVCQRVGIIKSGHLIADEQIDQLEYKHLRHVEVRFADAVTEEELKLPQVVSVSCVNDHWRLTVKGDVDPVIKALARHRVLDVTFTHATLEEVFLEYYGSAEP